MGALQKGMRHESSVSRRDFVAAATAAVGGAALASQAAVAFADEADEGAAEDGESSEVTWDEECDVIVVGSGAGLFAAYEAADAGADVILLEKRGILGGTVRMSDGIITAGGTGVQADAGIEDDVDTFWEEYCETSSVVSYAAAYAGYDESFAKQIVEQSGECVDTLAGLGLEFNLQMMPYDDKTAPRMHIMQPDATAYVDVLEPAIEEKGVRVMLETPATALVMGDDGSVHGVEAQSGDDAISIKARKGVILATGDCQSDDETKGYYNSASIVAIPGANEGNTGDGLRMATKVGAATSGSLLQCAVAYFDIGNLIATSVWEKGAILVNSSGVRFVDETDGTSTAIAINEGAAPAYCIFSADVADYLHTVDPYDATDILEGKSMYVSITPGHGLTYLEDLEEDGYLYEADTLEELADLIEVPSDALVETVSTWNSYVEAGEDPDFGHGISENVEDLYGPTVALENGPFYALRVQAAFDLYSEGPALITSLDYEVLDSYGEPISRLYACGAGLTQGAAPHIICGGGTHVGGGIVGARISASNAAALEDWE